MSEFEYPMYLVIEELPVRVERGYALAFDVPNGRRYSWVEAMRNGRIVSREQWEKIVEERSTKI